MINTVTVGLTGGIASGKSAVSQLFDEIGVDVIDADIIARDVVAPNSQGLVKLVKFFGGDILLEDGTLNRAKLRKIVFNNDNKLEQLNAILHPLIQEKIKDRVKQVKMKYCIVVIPLLCESQSYQWLDRILLVDVDVDTQMKRLMKRDSMTRTLSQKMIDSQCTRAQRISIADDVINNEKSLAILKDHVKLLNNLYLNLK